MSSLQWVDRTWRSYDLVEALIPFVSMWKGEVKPHLNFGIFCLLRFVFEAISERIDS